MADTTRIAAPPTTPADSKSAGTDGRATLQSSSSAKVAAAGPHIAAAATIDEILANEARANLRRSRATARDETVKYKPRALVPPAKIVVRPSQPHAWMTPFVSLAVIVGLSTSLSAGAIAYLFVRPAAVATAAEAEIRSLRDSMAVLRRNVADLSAQLATHRPTPDAANKVAEDRAGRIAQSAERDLSVPATRSERKVDVASQNARPMPTALSPDVTGTLPQRTASASREVLAGWHIRRAYDGAALLEGKMGVIEVTLGQDVPDLGRIQEIKYENGSWQVLTSKGLISKSR